MSVHAAIFRWLNERLGLDDIVALLKHKTVPRHRLSYWYFFGGITLFLFGVQVVTTNMVPLYTRPGANEASEGARYIKPYQPYCCVIRPKHSWSANRMIFFAFVHM